ncbi:nonsense-mediated mRNA decay factor SMG7-like [Cornus florida]|uniref:nonsense-mediated mRNA decay factor SMG7-like n=1 Tax=Cornus florida TaxID=4283 RepID=UPI002896DADF|nr:nonsense-mediated mRNA decay factor SMG7-like [Cornus florida]XP_059668309.1 nonsense-mediated mRNA decay factor SMG7-like [Cornus florida]XP_059668310.1 nonsense-mediated mRNA decay factor SMG7-like [Cornus florida]XP_059668311.1 nonsense-mediated mRNA decay factor SMG7-like [Cornus florida]
MTILMDNAADISSREHVLRLYNKNVELENRRRKAAQARVPSDPNAWQQMRENYEAIVLEDHAFSEQHEIEYALWQLHYRRIEELRAHLNAALASTGSITSHNGKGSTRPGSGRVTKIRSQFKTFLSEAAGFYHDLMVKIGAKYDLPLGYFSNDAGNQIVLSKYKNRSAEVKKGLISCHRCLIYLGDLARYKGLYGEGDSKAQDFKAASSYYMQASSLWPSSGNPHHQLAILASYSGDELVAVYQYFRSLAVDNPFTTARDNLIIAFEKNRQSYAQLLGDAKASSVKMAPVRMTGKGRGKCETRPPLNDSRVEASIFKERESSLPETFKAFSIRFVRLNGILFTRTSLETFDEVFSMAISDLLELLSSGPDEEYNFGSDAAESRLVIIRLIAILIYTVHNVNKETENQSYAEILQRSVLLQKAFTAIFVFMGHIFERCIQLNDPSTSRLLPGVMVFVEWLACCPDIAVGCDVEEKQASSRSSFWTHCISFLNKLLASEFLSVNEDKDETCFFNMSRYDEDETTNRLALSEDFELRGFLPLLPAQIILDFSRKNSFGSDGGNKEKKARVQRIIAAGKALANVVCLGQQGIYFDPKAKKFVIGIEPQMPDDYSLSSSLESPVLNGIGQENLLECQKRLGVLQSKAQLYMEGEEEDEMIVFKPSVSETHVDRIASELTSYKVLGSGVNASKVDWRSHVGSVSESHDGFAFQNALNTSSRSPTSLANIPVQHMQPIQPSTSRWLVEQQTFAANGLSNLSLLDSGLPVKPELQDHVGVLQSSAFSVPFPQSVNLGAGNKYLVQVPETVVRPNFDSIMSSGAGVDSLSIKSSEVMAAGLRKNPVNRPLRHCGPPPGFSPLALKLVDESLPDMSLKNENRPMDDYIWLDGYRLPSSTQGIRFNNSTNYSAHGDHLSSKSSSSLGTAGFPFPGKQVSTLQVQVENEKGWQDNQFPEHLRLYQDQQQQLQKGNQQSVAFPKHYQGQSIWAGHFVV